MSKVMISVRGTAQSQIAPEIAIARVAVQFDGAERIGVSSDPRSFVALRIELVHEPGV